MSRKKSSSRWLARQRQDPYVAQAQSAGYRSRAVYKLEELDKKYNLVQSSRIIVDLGAAPGAWSQYCVQNSRQPATKVIALDILPMVELGGVTIITGDFTEDKVLDELVQVLSGEAVDLVLSDMAPNISGNKAVDQPKSMYLCELALDFAHQHLKQNGGFVVKLFQGVGYPPYITDLKAKFKQVNMVKPQASRKESSEMYAVARGFGL